MTTSNVVPSREVFNWPEYKALANRLGIRLEKSVASITIKLSAKDPVVVQYEFFPTIQKAEDDDE